MDSWWQRVFYPKLKKNYSLSDITSLMFPSKNKNMINSNVDALEQSVWILRAIQSICQTASAIPWHIYTKDGKIDERAEDKLKNCNREFTFVEIHEKTLAWQCIEGYAPWYVEMGIVNPLDADKLEVIQNTNGSYSYRYRGGGYPMLSENIVIFPNFTPFASVIGLSELKACIDLANLGENAIRLANNIMLSGGLLTGMLSTDQELTDDDVEKLITTYKRKYGGIDNSGEILIAGRGIKYNKIGISPSEFSMLDITKVTRNGVSVAFGVPEDYLSGTENINYANSKVHSKIFITTTIQPKNDKFADRINRFVLPKLLKVNDRTFAFDWAKVEALQEDKLMQAQVDEIDIRIGKRFINEVRARDGQAPVPWGDSFWGSLSQVQLDTIKTLQDAVIKIDVLYNEVKKDKERINKIFNKYTQDDRERIWRRFVLKTESQEKRLIKEVSRYLDEQMQAVIEKLKQETKGIDDIDFIPASWDQKFAKMLKPFYLVFMQQAGDEAVNEYAVGISFDLQRPEIQKWIEWKLKDSAVKVNDTTREAIKEQLKEAVKEGEGIPQMADRIRGLFEETYAHRAETISRTEVICANNKATLEGMEQCGIKTKEWLTAIDERTRDEHIAADGQVVGINERFNVGGEELDFPGDPSGSPENVINCRCTLIYGGE